MARKSLKRRINREFFENLSQRAEDCLSQQRFKLDGEA